MAGSSCVKGLAMVCSMAAVVGAGRGLAAPIAPPSPQACVPTCVPESSAASSPLERAIDAVARTSDQPVRTRRRLLERLMAEHRCLPPNITDQQMEEVLRQWDTLPESVTGPRGLFHLRFNVAAETLTGDGAIGPSGRAIAAALTYSFPPDVVIWGSGNPPSAGPNVLGSTHVAQWSATTTDLGREYIRQGFANFRKWAGVTYTEVTDDGRPFDTVSGRRAGVGDLRIGGALVNSPTFIAYNNFPANGSDMFIDTAYYANGTLNNAANDFRALRNTIVHEHGHGVGKIHQVPCNNTKLMEPVLATGFEMMQVDDIRAAQSNFGDRFSGNHTPATAAYLGDITGGPTGRSIRQLMLSTNGAFSPTNPTGADWFRLDSSVAGRVVVFRVKPVGGTYTTGSQMAQPNMICAGAAVAVNASQAGNLRLELYFLNPNGAPFAVSSAGGPGANEELGFLLGTGVHYLRVADDGPNPSANQVLQLYDLEILVNSQPSEPIAIAGVNKVAYVGELCAITPSSNSQATEPGATITAYQYDLDGDGIFETSGSTGSTVFNTPGVRNVTVRAIDSNGKTDDDTIVVNVLSKDNCDGAQQVYVNTPLPGTTAGATASGDALHTCVTGSDAGHWYRFVPAATAAHSISTCPIVVDTVVSVFSGSCDGGLTSIGCNDDDPVVCPGTNRASLIPNITLNAGQSYFIKVSGFLNASGAYTLNVNQSTALGACCRPTGLCEPTDQARCTGGTWASGGTCLPNTCAPVNDACSSAIALTLNAPITGTTSAASNTDADNNAFGCFFGSGKIVWFTFTPTGSTRYKVNTCGTAFGNSINVFATACGNNTSIACDDSNSPNPACPGGAAASARIGSIALNGGTTYRISLGGVFFGGTSWDSGPYQIVVRCFADFNDSGAASVQDIFDFLSAYFSNDPAADTNASGGISVQDIFDFLSAYFAGCA